MRSLYLINFLSSHRLLLVECNPSVCKAGERCMNQVFEKRVYPPLMPYKTKKRGWGLKTLVDMKKGKFVINVQYCPE